MKGLQKEKKKEKWKKATTMYTHKYANQKKMTHCIPKLKVIACWVLGGGGGGRWKKEIYRGVWVIK